MAMMVEVLPVPGGPCALVINNNHAYKACQLVVGQLPTRRASILVLCPCALHL